MAGTKVEIFFENRAESIVAYINDSTPDEMTTAWDEAVFVCRDLFVLTEKNGARLTIRPNRVELFVCVPWNGV